MRFRPIAICLLTVPAALAASLAAQPRFAEERQLAPGIAPTVEQLDNVARRIEIATAVVARLEIQAKQRGRADGWRRVTLDSLLALPLRRLELLSAVGDVDALSAALAEGAGDDTPFDVTSTRELTYFPVAPCRYIDTRNVGGRIGGAVRGYDLVNSGDVYGGSASCDMAALFPVTNLVAIGALALNVTIVDPAAAPGFVAVKPTQAAPVSSLINWYQAGPSVQLANQAIVALARGSATEEFWIQASDPVHVIADVFGAFIVPFHSRVGQKMCVGYGNGTFSTQIPVPSNWTPRMCSDWVTLASGIGTGPNSFFRLGCVFDFPSSTPPHWFDYGSGNFRICDAPGPYCAGTSPQTPPSAYPNRNCGW